MLVAVVSVKGSPGVTTFSLALAARWPVPARTLVVEADPSGGDIALRFSLASTPGLVSLAAAARHSSDSALVWQHAQSLPGGLPVVSAPPDADGARAALSALAEPITGAGLIRAAANPPGMAVIVWTDRHRVSGVADRALGRCAGPAHPRARRRPRAPGAPVAGDRPVDATAGVAAGRCGLRTARGCA